MAAGHDSGMIVFKLDREQPASMRCDLFCMIVAELREVLKVETLSHVDDELDNRHKRMIFVVLLVTWLPTEGNMIVCRRCDIAVESYEVMN